MSILYLCLEVDFLGFPTLPPTLSPEDNLQAEPFTGINGEISSDTDGHYSTLCKLKIGSRNDSWFYLTDRPELTFPWSDWPKNKPILCKLTDLTKSATLTLVNCWPPVALVLKIVQSQATNSNNKRKWLKTSPVPARLTIFIEPYKCVISASSSIAINLSHPNPSEKTNPGEEPICRAIAERRAAGKPCRNLLQLCARRHFPQTEICWACFCSAIPPWFHCSLLQNLSQTSQFPDVLKSHQTFKLYLCGC